MDAGSIGRLLIVLGLGLAGVGALVLLLGQVVDLGNLPGDIAYRGDDVSVFIPIGTMIVVSIVLTVVLNLILRLFR